MTGDVDLRRAARRIAVPVGLVVAGLVVVCLLTWLWLVMVVVPGADDIAERVITDYTPLVFLIVTLQGAVMTTILFAIFEWLRASDRHQTAFSDVD